MGYLIRFKKKLHVISHSLKWMNPIQVDLSLKIKLYLNWIHESNF